MKITAILFFYCLISIPSFGQNARKVAVLDMSVYNPSNSSASYLSAVRIMRTVGVPYTITNNLFDAIQYPIIITGSRIEANSFSVAQRNALKSYVQNGGVLISSCLRDPLLFGLCGITSRATSNELYRITFDTSAASIFNYINDDAEVTVSLGDSSLGSTFYTQYYGLGQGQALAYYEDSTVAFVKTLYGQGEVYLFGPDFKDVIFRNQLDYDSKAQRMYSNGFEPTTDVFFLLIRNIIRTHLPHTVYKYTIPGTRTSSIMFTHDIDSRSAIDTMNLFSDYEKSKGIQAMYNITTRYFHDGLMSNFYINSWPEINQLIQDGHILASHSVGHFPDFDDETIFPLGNLGNTVSSYSPAYHSGITSGGSVYGELEVSKSLLENDHSVSIKTFRAGYLAYNDSLIMGLENLGYQFNSTFSANNVLTSFPYYGVRIRSFDAVESSVLEIPMTISDVFNDISAANYMDKVNIWLNATNKYNANHAPVVLLIHPNRKYKLEAEKSYMNQIPQSMSACSMEEYGRFWLARDSLKFHTTKVNNALVVTFENNHLRKDQSFVLDFSGLDTVHFVDYQGNSINFNWKLWDFGTRLYYQKEVTLGLTEPSNFESKILVYPNPTDGKLTISLPNSSNHNQYEIFNFLGQKLMQGSWNGNDVKLDLSGQNFQSGIYFIQIKHDGRMTRKKIIYKK